MFDQFLFVIGKGGQNVCFVVKLIGFKIDLCEMVVISDFDVVMQQVLEEEQQGGGNENVVQLVFDVLFKDFKLVVIVSFDDVNFES